MNMYIQFYVFKYTKFLNQIYVSGWCLFNYTAECIRTGYRHSVRGICRGGCSLLGIWCRPVRK